MAQRRALATASALVALAARAARWLRPHAIRGLRALGRGLAMLGRASWRQRRTGVSLASRAAWWAALWLLAIGGARLIGWQVEAIDRSLWTPFAIGVALCAAIVLLAPARRLRLFGSVLGTAHGAMALLTWLTCFA